MGWLYWTNQAWSPLCAVAHSVAVSVPTVSSTPFRAVISAMNHHDNVCILFSSTVSWPQTQCSMQKPQMFRHTRKKKQNSRLLARLEGIHYWDISKCCNAVTTWSLTCSCAGGCLFHITDLYKSLNQIKNISCLRLSWSSLERKIKCLLNAGSFAQEESDKCAKCVQD